MKWLFLLLPTLLFGCISQQIGDQAAYIKHTKPLRQLYEPHLRQTELPRLVCQWTHGGSHYCVRASAEKTLINWYIEVRHADGSCYRHYNPEPSFNKALYLHETDDIRVRHRHRGEQLILIPKHRNNAEITLHAHNLGLIRRSDQQTNATATATLQQAVQHAAQISLVYADGNEYQLTEWEQQTMRRILKGAQATTLTGADYGSALIFYDDDEKPIYRLPISEYHVTSGMSNNPGTPFMPCTIPAGDYHKTMLVAWWSGVRLRLRLPSLLQLRFQQSESKIHAPDGNNITGGFISCSGIIPDELLKDLHKKR